MNIEELARQAGTCQSLNGYFFQWELSDLERFAVLVLEQAAQKADELDCAHRCAVGREVGKAIRVMKPNR